MDIKRLYKAAIFDLDGTLIDSLEDIAYCMNKVFLNYNKPTYPVNEYKYLTGYGSLELIKSILGKSNLDNSDDIAERMRADYQFEYDMRNNLKSKPYRNILYVLGELYRNNIPLGIVSNKPHEQVSKIVSQFFPDIFSHVLGSKDGIPIKPNPSKVFEMAMLWGFDPTNIVIFGDSEVDMKTSVNANMYGVGVLWGFRDLNELITSGAKMVISNPIEILDLF